MLQTVNETLQGINGWSVAFRILFAALIGGCIGSERGRHGRAAGLRTHILVCLGAAMTTMIGMYVSEMSGGGNDPLRVGAQVVSGIGFLGAGTIMIRNRSQVTGLTTAAGLWVTACIGLAVGVGFYWAALAAFLVVIITVSILSRLETTIKPRDNRAYYIELADIHGVRELYEEISALISEVDIVPAKSGDVSHVGLEIVTDSAEHSESLMAKMQQRSEVIIAVPLKQ